MIQIEQITPQLTWRLRHEVLYPDLPLHQMWMEEDDEGYHFGAYLDNELIGVTSLFINGNNFQFRKFAIAAKLQGKGFGRDLLTYITNFAKSEGASRLWCNARIGAIGFYQKSGFEITAETFSKNGFDYVVMQKPIK